MKALLELLDQVLYLLEHHDAPDAMPLPQQTELKNLLEGLVREALSVSKTLREDLSTHEEQVRDASRRESLLQDALAAIAHAQYSRAESILHAALHEFPEHDEYYNHLGLVAWERGDMERAEGYYARAAEICLMTLGAELRFSSVEGKNYLRALEGRALCLYQLGHFEEAIELFETLSFTQVPEYQGCFYLAGEIHHLCGRPARAISFYKQAPVEPAVLYNMALAYFQADDLEAAAAAFIRAFASNRYLCEMLLGRTLSMNHEFSGYLSSPMYAEEFMTACKPLWTSRESTLSFMQRCYDHPLVQHQLHKVNPMLQEHAFGVSMSIPDSPTEELRRVQTLAQRVLERIFY